MKRWLDLDQLLIFFLLAVTVSQMGYYLATFAAGWKGIGYLQAIAIDCAIWRSAYWFRRYEGRKQRRYAALGVVAFALVSAWYNRNYYAARIETQGWQGVAVSWLMGIVLPLGVALLSFLYGVKDGSKFSVANDSHLAKSQPVTESVTKRDEVVEPIYVEPPAVQTWRICAKCGYKAKNHWALSGHMKSHSNGHGEKVAEVEVS